MTDQLDKNLTVIILAGGKSSRMGQDKGLMFYDGQPMIQYVIEIAEQLTKDILIVSNKDDYNQFNYPVLPDIIQDKGPLAGVVTGLESSTTDLNLILTCDAPFITVEFLNWLKIRMEQFDVAIPQYENRIYPLTGYYKRTTLPVLKRHLDQNNLRIKSVIESLNTQFIKADDFNQQNFRNLNTVEDL
ncbi:molybdenum cofactor guanylyltransferase [Crocinitomix catalasitica]|uniref:molybdenum cofactor guanylyltransferase n=1 Tax=Crocinitomix catalasitica TaxID=184607 RepID=UPI000484367C|nr:molybdenum cofactor guanylyltransferase [Crocinitomix catalasitica]